MLSLHIESINSMISGKVATVHLCSFAECMYRLGNTTLGMCTISRYYQRYVEDNKPILWEWPSCSIIESDNQTDKKRSWEYWLALCTLLS